MRIELVCGACSRSEVGPLGVEDAARLPAHAGKQQPAFDGQPGRLQRALGRGVEAARQLVKAVRQRSQVIPAQTEIQLELARHADVVLHIGRKHLFLTRRLAVHLDDPALRRTHQQ